MESLKRAIRSLRQSPLVAVPSILSLALGIGVTTALFSVLNTALLKPLPVRDPQSVVVVYTQDAKNPGFLGVSYPNLRDLREKGDAFAELAAFQWTTLGLSGNAEPEQIFGQVVSGNYFDLLGIRMAHGRGFLPEEDRSPGAQPVVVLSHSLWARRYGADPSMVGRQVVLNRQPYTVVGVAPPEFRGTDVGRQPQLWVPLMMYPVAFPYPYNTWVESRRAVMFNVLARLRPGTDLAGTEARANGLAHRLEEQYPEDNRGRSWKLVPLAQATINPAQRGAVVGGVGYLLGAATLVLLLACANVASLQLGRLIAQRKDIAIQVALGASRWRVVRNFLVESLLPSALACVLGLLIALLGLRLLTTIRPPTEIPTSLEVAIDSRVLLFALGLTLLVTLLLGLTPILQVVGTDLVSALKGAVRVRRATGAGLQGLLVAVQAGLSCFCLLAATLFLTSLAQAERADPGFEAGHLAVVSFNAGAQGQPEEDVQDFYRRVVERVEALPGVRSAALATAVPLSGGAVPRTVFLEGQSENLSAGGVLVQVDPIGVDYFQTLGIALEAGRTFSRDDRKETEPVAVVNRAMAERFWAGRGAIGKRFRFFGEESYLRVVGVVNDSKYNTLGEEPQAYLYLPLAQNYSPRVTLFARVEGDPTAFLSTLRREVQQLDTALPLTNLSAMRDVLAHSLWALAASARLVEGFALLALALAGIGVFSVTTYMLGQRAPELGLRMILGADRSQVLGLLLRQGLWPVALGMGLGLLAFLGTRRLAASVLYGTGQVGLLASLGAAAVLALVALLAVALPARQAARLNPAGSLRSGV